MTAGAAFDQARLGTAPGIVGIDEAGRGALAGPVGVGAVYLSRAFYEGYADMPTAQTLTDSKALSPLKREQGYAQLLHWQKEGLLRLSYAEGTLQQIETKGIVFAIQSAMQTALQTLEAPSQAPVWVDGRPLKTAPFTHKAIIKGDALSLAIGMASIVAKVLRDQKLKKLSSSYPLYGLAQHKGYATTQHRSAIQQHGPHPLLHRSLYLRNLLGHRQLELKLTPKGA